MANHTDFSRERIMRRRTPSKRDRKLRKEREVKDESNLGDKKKEKKEEVIIQKIVEPYDYMVALQKQVNKKFDSHWKSRSEDEYQTAMLIKVSNLIDIYGWKWWNLKEDVDMNAFMIRLTELYQFIISIYIKDKKAISTESIRPISIDGNILKSMMERILAKDIDSLANIVRGLFAEQGVNPLILNTVCLVSRYIRLLPRYITGEYTPLGYVDNDMELMEECMKDNKDILEKIAENVYEFHGIPKEEHLIIKM